MPLKNACSTSSLPGTCCRLPRSPTPPPPPPPQPRPAWPPALRLTPSPRKASPACLPCSGGAPSPANTPGIPTTCPQFRPSLSPRLLTTSTVFPCPFLPQARDTCLRLRTARSTGPSPSRARSVFAVPAFRSSSGFSRPSHSPFHSPLSILHGQLLKPPTLLLPLLWILQALHGTPLVALTTLCLVLP